MTEAERPLRHGGESDETLFRARERISTERIDKLRERTKDLLGGDWNTYGKNSTTIYVTGSSARGEASSYSDVDLFVARVGAERLMLDEAVVISAVTRALAAEGLEPPSKDGEFLYMHEARSLIEKMGQPRDDFENTFTARMLLILESKPLLGQDVYQTLLEEIVDAYWKNVDGHEDSYIPMILVNDIVRYWRILLLNHEWKVTEKEKKDDRRGSRALSSYKLRFSRCLMCHSALAEMLFVFAQEKTITREAAWQMIRRRPLERLSFVDSTSGNESVRSTIAQLRASYARFLRETDHPKEELAAEFADERFRKERSKESRDFVKAMADLHQALAGDDRRLFNLLIV